MSPMLVFLRPAGEGVQDLTPAATGSSSLPLSATSVGAVVVVDAVGERARVER